MDEPSGRATAMRCCGVRIDCIDLAAAASYVVNRAKGSPRERQPTALHLCNAWTLACGRADPSLARCVDAGDLNLPDGMPLVWLARRFGVPLADRVYGPDLMRRVLDTGRDVGLRHFFYGTTPETLERLRSRVVDEYPGVLVARVEAPPFRRATGDEVADLAARIDEVGAGVVWVGLGTPHQDELVQRLRDRTTAVLIPVGAAFDFLAGEKRQAPRWMQRYGLEWAYRLASEPRRLWRRYLWGNLSFVAGVLPDVARASRGGPADPLAAVEPRA